MTNPIRVGVVGIGRGLSFAHAAPHVGMKLVALCDAREDRLREVAKQFDVTPYTDFDRFLAHDLDAVVLANYFHQHAPLAIKALAAGKHVMSETAACKTLAEGAALCRAVEKSGKIYLFAENYPYTAFNQEMRCLYRAGEIGEVLYAEGEYNHAIGVEDWTRISPGMNHWRSWIPPTYYCTHALAPLMYVTDTMPTSVNALSISAGGAELHGVRRADPGCVILCRMNNGSVFRIMGLLMPGHSIWYRFHGMRGLMESVRGEGYWGTEQVRISHESYEVKPGEPRERVYKPDFPEHAEAARKAGHGGGDFFTTFHFARAIQTGEQPWLDVYRGVSMSAVGIVAWKSCLENGRPFDLPDFRDESTRSRVENDHWSPLPEDASPKQPPPSILGLREPSRAAVDHAQRIWREMGIT